jgi:hypothetical protein
LRQICEPRRAKLLQRRERKLVFCLVANGAQHLKVARARDHVLQERGFADARLAVDDDCCAVTVTRIVEQLIERPALSHPTDEGRPMICLRATDEIHGPVP